MDAGSPALRRHHIQRVLFQRLQACRHLRRIFGSPLGQHNPVASPPKQSYAQKIFQCGDLSRYGALGQRQLLRSARVALVAGSGVKAGQCLKRWNFSAHDVRNIHNM